MCGWKKKKKKNDLTKKLYKYKKKGYYFLLRRMHFIDHDGYQNFQIFAPILSSLTLDNNKKRYCLDIDWNIT